MHVKWFNLFSSPASAPQIDPAYLFLGSKALALKLMAAAPVDTKQTYYLLLSNRWAEYTSLITWGLVNFS